jgi:orotate phosphoribosyltransferase
MARGKTKSHGAPEDKYFIGSPKGNVVIIEDVVTTGGSLINFIDQIKDLDITIKGVVCLTNRNTKSNVLDAQLKERNIQLHSMSNLKNLIADFLSIKNISNPELLYELKNELNFVEQKQAI